MREEERLRGLCRSPQLLFEVLVLGRYRFVYDRIPMLAEKMSWSKRVNLICSGLNLVWRRPKPWGMPLHLQFEFTSYCNLRCPGCPTGLEELGRSATAMSPELFERVYDETAPYLLTASLWVWGESLLHPQLKRMLEIAARYPVITLLSTNGMPLQWARVREALLEYPPSILIVAIDGLTDETNSRYRVGARLAPILEGVRELAEAKRKLGQNKPELLMRFIAMRHNVHQLGELETFARQYGFESVSIRGFTLKDLSQREQNHELVPVQPELAHKIFDAERQAKGFVCQMPFWFPSILADGTVVACEQDHMGSYPLGKVGVDGTFRDIWYSPRAAQVRRLIRDSRHCVSFCQHCPYETSSTSDCSLLYWPVSAPRANIAVEAG